MARNYLLSMRLTIFFGILAFCVLWISTDGSGRTIIVDDDGGGDFTTIQEAINASGEGDVIRVYNGTYNESLIVNVSVSIIGNGSEGVRINGPEDTDAMTITANNTMIGGLYVVRDGDTSSIVVMSQSNELFDLKCWGGEGVILEDSHHNTLRNLSASIDLIRSNNNVIAESSRKYSSHGISLIDSNNNIIKNQTIISYTLYPGIAQVSLVNSHNNQIINGIFLKRPFLHRENEGIGILLTRSHNNSLVNNTTFDHECGIKLIESINTTMQRNVMVNDGFSIEGKDIEYWATHTIDTTNMLYDDYTSNEYRILYYYANERGIRVPANGGQVILANCTKMTVTDQNCSDIETGISLVYSSHNYIARNNCSSNWEDGIYLWESNFNRIIGNTISDNVFGAGIMLWLSFNNLIEDNVLTGHQHYNIFIHSSNNTLLVNNTSSFSNHGIIIQNSTKCIIENNQLFENYYGVRLDYFSDNSYIIDNEIRNNIIGIMIDYSSTTTISYCQILNNTIGIKLDGEYYALNNSAHYNQIIGNVEGINASEQYFYPWHNFDFDESRFMDARFNEWVTDSGPYHPENNPRGKGDNITYFVTFEPWLDESGRYYYVEERDLSLLYILVGLLIVLFSSLGYTVLRKDKGTNDKSHRDPYYSNLGK